MYVYAFRLCWLYQMIIFDIPMEPELNCRIHDVINIIDQIFTM